MRDRVPDKEGKVVKVEYFKKSGNVFARHITRECLYTKEQLQHLMEYKREEARRIRGRTDRNRDELIASDMEKNANQMQNLLEE